MESWQPTTLTNRSGPLPPYFCDLLALSGWRLLTEGPDDYSIYIYLIPLPPPLL